MYYAELHNGICIGISQLSDKVYDKILIEIDSYDISIMGKEYNDGIWLDKQVEK
mgnify:CR=1 FL=1